MNPFIPIELPPSSRASGKSLTELYHLMELFEERKRAYRKISKYRTRKYKMSKELEALKRIWEMTGNKEDFELVETALKALETIKECFVLNGFDELIPNSKWFDKANQDLLRRVLEEETAMKKKRIDLSIEELRNTCHKKGQLCRDCPLFSKKLMTCIESYLRIKQLIDEDELNEEVEVINMAQAKKEVEVVKEDPYEIELTPEQKEEAKKD